MPTVNSLCLFCRKAFVKKRKTHSYCSPKCRWDAWLQQQPLQTAPPENALCLFCRKVFVKARKHQVYCAAKCRWGAWLQRRIARGRAE